MLSICIPVYNHSFIRLAKVLYEQCIAAKIEFEILVSDDCSTEAFLLPEKNQFQELDHSKFIQPKQNLGNDQNRNFLADTAQYKWLLFLDADTIPISESFIENYLKIIQDKPADAYSGGVVYSELENPDHILRWKHGKAGEENKGVLNEDDFLGFRGCNFLIKRDVYLKVPFIKLPQKYGYQDTVFGINLKLNKYTLKLIENPVEHKGLMDSKTFLLKTREAIEYVYYLENHFPEIAEHIKIIKLYRTINKIGLGNMLSKGFNPIEKQLYRQLLSKKPSLYLFQIYKLGYLLQLNSEKIANKSAS